VLRGKWRLDAVVGVGGMASVYSATHRNQSRAAIKILHPEVALIGDVTARFLREGYVANAVGHPGTVRVIDDDVTEDGAPFLVMELLVGQTLDDLLAREPGGLAPEKVLPLVDEVLSVVAAAHDKEIVHRDLKPENVFLTEDGRVKLLDFGVARLREISADSAAGTRAGSLLGTPAFMAPEQALGRWREVDGRTDIWAIGAMLFTLLTGRFVHEAETVQEQLVLSATRRARSLRSVAAHIQIPLAEVVDRALGFERGERFPDARTMQFALRRAASLTLRASALTLPLVGVSAIEDLSSGPAGNAASLAPGQEPVRTPPGIDRADTVSTGAAVVRTQRESLRPRTRGLLAVSLLGLALGAALYFSGIWKEPSLRTPGPSARIAGSSEIPARALPTISPPSSASLLPSAAPTPRPAANAKPAHLAARTPPNVSTESNPQPRGGSTKSLVPSKHEPDPFDRRH
jgi:serine/threonine-protein kinase